ncbi:MAG: TonB family protein [Brevinematales bacterium]|nr:TonB family protein [Brevinematales bacterium]
MEVSFFSKNYSPKWDVFLAVSILIHVLALILIFISLREVSLDVKVKEVKINLMTSQTRQTPISISTPQTAQTSKKQLTKNEVDDIVFQIVSPKLQRTDIPSYESKEVASPTTEIVPSERKLGIDARQQRSEKTMSIKGGTKSDVIEEVGESEILVRKPTPIPSSKASSADSISGNITWIKGGPRKVIEWYSPEIPPNIIKKQTEIILTFYIEPSGFVSRVEILKTSGEPLIDDIIQKTMRRIRFNAAEYNTVANVSIVITPK